MKNLLLILLIFTTLNISAQHGRDREDMYKNISVDIFGDLQYRSKNGFKASLKKNIFDDIIYSDDNSNETKYSKEQWAELLNKFQDDRENCFVWLIKTHRGVENTKEEYKVNIFGDKVYKDNFGNSETYKRNIFGDLVYENSNRQEAKLRKNIFDEMEYSDSKGTTRKYKTKEWENLLKKYYDEEAIFKILVRKYLLSDL